MIGGTSMSIEVLYKKLGVDRPEQTIVRIGTINMPIVDYIRTLQHSGNSLTQISALMNFYMKTHLMKLQVSE